MGRPPATVTADLVYLDGRFERGRVLALDASGRITDVASGSDAELNLHGCAIIPGFVNGHSHAFQRALRGRTASRPADRAAHFWTWRDEMYRLVQSLTPDSIYEISLLAFREMAAAGFTTVGEFHYLHRDSTGRPYDDQNLLARRVVDAACEAGLRIVLINVFYERGGMRGEALCPAQRRFSSGIAEEFVARSVDLARAYVEDDRVTVGLAAHSLRAVSPESIRLMLDLIGDELRPFHIHLSEQLIEVEESEAVYGARPVELMHELGALDSRTTGVHCTHITDLEVELLARSGATVCACPTTEADLGDGFLRGEELRGAGVRVSLGSDSQARIDPFEEMRTVEYHERLRHRRRNVLVAPSLGTGGEGEVAAENLAVAGELLAMGARSGAESLRVEAGELGPGRWADLVAVDLEHPVLAGWTDDTLGSRLALSADPRVVYATYVAGRLVASLADQAS